MNVIFHRGYLGFQPASVCAEISYSFTKPVIESFIADGMLYLPVSLMDADTNDLGNVGTVMLSYTLSRGIYYRWLQWDDRGPCDNSYIKMSNDPIASYPSYNRVPLSSAISTSAVLALKNDSSEEYLPALVHADATLDQIDSFCCEFGVGSGRPFVWNKYNDVKNLINASVTKTTLLKIKEVYDGPSRQLPDSISETLKDPIPQE